MMGHKHPFTRPVLDEWCQADPYYLQEPAHPHPALAPQGCCLSLSCKAKESIIPLFPQ